MLWKKKKKKERNNEKSAGNGYYIHKTQHKASSRRTTTQKSYKHKKKHMSDPPISATFKLLLIGDSGTGKSSLLLQFTDENFDKEINSTIGKPALHPL